jgi:protein TonB
MVFLMSPGPGGGGGGSGARQRQPPAPIERKAPERRSIAVPNALREPVPTARVNPEPAPPAVASEPRPQEVEPLAARSVIAPIVVTRSGARDSAGVVDTPSSPSPSAGPGEGGSAGTGRGAGNGEGLGSGIGDGAGGGTGGGPFRPGAGIEPPRLVREVKATYPEEARVRGVTGAVLLEIVVRRDGSVGDVTLRRGLSSALDREAIAAVRQWTFVPARRLGAPVDVVVEVAVEFTQR